MTPGPATDLRFRDLAHEGLSIVCETASFLRSMRAIWIAIFKRDNPKQALALAIDFLGHIARIRGILAGFSDRLQLLADDIAASIPEAPSDQQP